MAKGFESRAGVEDAVGRRDGLWARGRVGRWQEEADVGVGAEGEVRQGAGESHLVCQAPHRDGETVEACQRLGEAGMEGRM